MSDDRLERVGEVDQDAPTALRPTPTPAGHTRDVDQDAPTVMRRASAQRAPAEDVDQDAPTVMRKASAAERPERTPAQEAERVRIHPKFDPRKAPTEVRKRPTKSILDGTIPLATLPLPRVYQEVRPIGPSDTTLGWILSITIAALVTAAVAVLLHAAKQGG